ncbi:uncharacterized protein LOC135658711 [Musa acuminata AAA Group]|uniref:uncharacterized protein LOC135658705 n=1 Tax=Musa acuminata AAA Group TaxID=214697 RepID=UPI0031DA185D
MWDLGKCSKIWSAKSPPSNRLGIFSPTWFTAATFLSEDDHRKVVAGTINHQIRLYDTSAQRRPVISVDFRESPIKAACEDLDGYTVYVGNGFGDLASFDMRTGLDSYLRVWDAKTRQLLSAVFLKQHLTNVVIDSHFSGSNGNTCDQQADLQVCDDTETIDNDELPISSGKKVSKRKRVGKVKKKRKSGTSTMMKQVKPMY